MLSSAVYEAWYFRYWMELAEARRLEVLKDQRKKEDLEKVETFLFSF
jgi:hypothetical protein